MNGVDIWRNTGGEGEVLTEPWWEDLKRPAVIAAALAWRRWTRPAGDASYDHDHCAFCFAEFSDTEPGALREGFATADEAIWVCADCFDIEALRDHFRLTRRTTPGESGRRK